MFKKLLKRIFSKKLINTYHLLLALFANYYYGQPSKKMIVIGVTGTNGKTTVVNLISWILHHSGKKTASTSTAQFFINGKKWLNDLKMTMPGRLYLQKFLAQAVASGCDYVVIETSSEGIAQNRHKGINYDVAVFTNLTPEHIEAHGSFENYRNAKLELWKILSKNKTKTIADKIVNKFSVINADSSQAPYFLQTKNIRHYTYAIETPADYSADIGLINNDSINFVLHDKTNDQNITVESNLPGKVNVYNQLAAISCCHQLGISLYDCAEALKKYPGTPGRYEFIHCNQPFDVMVDYAHEPEALTKLYETIYPYTYNKIIHVLGSCGGGRDQARRPILGKIAGDNANIVIITNEDPYDEDPKQIMNQVLAGTKETKINPENIFLIEERKQAIKKAMELAGENDLVLITGKGAEQWLCIANGEKIPWDDRAVVKELLEKN